MVQGPGALAAGVQVEVEHFPRALSPHAATRVELPEAATVHMLVAALKLHPDAVLVVRQGVPVPLDAPVIDGEHLRIVHTVSGG